MTQRGVSSAGVVENLDVLEDRSPRHLPIRPRVAMNQLPLEGRDEALGHGVVVGFGHRSIESKSLASSRRLENSTEAY